MDGFIFVLMLVVDLNYGFFFYGLVVFYVFVGFMFVGMLCVILEINVWRMVVGGVWMIDMVLLVSMYVSIE